MTKELFREDAYLRRCSAVVTDVNPHGGIILDQTVFYPTGGGQPGDSGRLVLEDGREIKISTTVTDRDSGEVIHVPEEGQTLPAAGAKVRAEIDWDRRYRHMRMHTALHLLCAAVPCGVTGGQIGEDKSRLDFDIGDRTLDKEEISATLNRLVEEDHVVDSYWITEQQLDQNPELVRTMSVQPPRGSGRVRLMKVGNGVDLQPCGGTHVKRTGEIGALRVSKIENKGKRNRRVNIMFAGG
ncbi:alanyl-tRNA editing protein [Emcibacter nanhaiensis]|uniref:Alanine--tRNA ligase n=1 Tax=Emcibacter nanhaiensis TaxID=1505037 RepID=A0A501PNS5_9PROT|nr:alanyl-tRNA editing protein [Emcibacter nanhaiensis]TPD61762.1 alanyl-tRNA editing protein [Emcibacter nanhaiensis]